MTPAHTASSHDFQSAIAEIAKLARNRKIPEARQRAKQACHAWPQKPEPWLITAQIEKQTGDFPAMLAATQKALALQNSIPVQQLHVEALSYCGKNKEAIKCLRTLKGQEGKSNQNWPQLGTLFTHMHQHHEAAECIDNAVKAGGTTAENLIALATSKMILGKLDEADKTFDQAIKAAPNAFEIYYARSSLRRQAPDDNHIVELQSAIARVAHHPTAHIPLRYALAKELEDLEEWDASFDQLNAGSAAKRKTMPYKVETDLQIIHEIIAAFNEDYFKGCPEGYKENAPIFVLGLPRSGSTLVDRILNASETVQSLGEVNDFPLALMRLAGPASNALERIKKSLEIKPQELGSQYCRAISGYGPKARHLLDKTPFNALNAGLIAAALPNAHIIHVKRNPMAVAYGVYKTLFRLGYPWSYSLDDIGRYMVAHHQLMEHWKNMLGDRLIEIEYEDLVKDQEATSQRLYKECGLEWTDASLSFHKDNSPVATASATQVRQPLYSWAMERWQHFETQLAPVANHLKANGMVI